jgi:hypothetical protein
MDDTVPRPVKTLSHKHFRFKALIKKPPVNETEGLSFMAKLVDGIGMEMAELSNNQSNPIAWYSTPEHNQGMTLSAILTTSNATIHIWDKEKELQFDLYSCANFDPDTVINLVDLYVGIDEIIWYDLIDREEGKILEEYKDEY